MRKVLFVFLTIVFTGASAIAQDRCGTVEYTKALRGRNQLRESPEGFERWLNQANTQRRLKRGGRTQAAYQIPVIIHVIHNGEAVGSGINISDEQIMSQLSVLNKDYNRMNADAGNTPAEFLPMAGTFNVEFVLAKQDPEGIATTGIVRVKGSKTSWTMNDNYQLKSQSYWPAEDYLNIWVCRLTDFLGYSQFPVSALPGLENSSTNRLTDGVVIAYNAFGSSDDGNFTLQNAYNKGRTATHEVGHFFGLNHIWGDDDVACTGTDYVDDTPNQAGSSSGCPTHPRITCSVTSMFQNYLDYTNDACMNLFTQGQVSRMEVVIENSPRRASLTSSHGLDEPAPLLNDLGVKEIIRPATGECSASFAPQIEVRNYGNNAIASARIRLRKDGAIVETKDFTFSPALGLLESRILTFSNISFTSGTHNASAEILLTNAMADGQPSNNSISRTFAVPESIALPFLESFDVVPADWEILNPDQDLTWALTSTATANTEALYMDFYNYEDHVGEIDPVISPTFDLSSEPAALLKFDVAYAQFGSSTDALKVLLLTNCNSNLEEGIVVYSKSGSALATASATSDPFTPSEGDWRTETVDLSQYIGQSNLQLAFVGFNDWGNNLYLDNIALTTSPIADVVASKILQPSPVSCVDQLQPVVRVFNAGTLITQLTITTTINGQPYTQTLNDLNIAGNTSSDIVLPSINFVDGPNQLQISLSNPNGTPDFFPSNNQLAMSTVHDATSESLPTRQRFDNGDTGTWIAANPTGGMNWQVVSISDNPVLYVNGFVNSTVGDQSWFVSPLLDFTDVDDGLLRYDYSYATRAGSSDVLYILASVDCGITFSDTLYRAGSGELAKGRVSESSWRPSGESDWTLNSIGLASLSGVAEARIAFVFRSGKGNNIYIDNLEFFLTSEPLTIAGAMEIYPTVPVNEPLNVTFDLPGKDRVRIDIIDGLGRVLNTYHFDGVLNQTYSFNVTQSAGLYYLRATTSAQVYVERFIIR